MGAAVSVGLAPLTLKIYKQDISDHDSAKRAEISFASGYARDTHAAPNVHNLIFRVGRQFGKSAFDHRGIGKVVDAAQSVFENPAGDVNGVCAELWAS